MTTSLKLLMVEDSADDAELLLNTLRRGGYDVAWQRVDTAAAMQIALMDSQWDIITSDHAMPYFSAVAALALARELRPEIPLIIVSGEIDLNLVVSLMKGGAQDYIQKNELARVVPAIERELADADARRQQRQTEDALERHLALMARIYDTSPVGIVMVDVSGQITFANPEAERVFCLAKDSMTQRTYNAPAWKITAFDGGLFPDDALPFVRVMSTGQPVRDVHHAIEWPDGRRVLLSINAAPLMGAAGEFAGMVATLHDITEQMRMAESLQESEARFRMLVNSMNDVVFTLDAQGRHTGVYGNWIEQAGLTPAYFLGRTSSEIMGSEAGRIHDLAAERAAQGETVVYDWSITLPDNSHVYYQTSLSPIYEHERITGVVGVGRNLTEQKRAEDEAHHWQEHLTAFFRLIPEMASISLIGERRYLEVSQAFIEITGYDQQDLVGENLQPLQLFADPVQHREIHRLVEEQGSVRNYPVFLRKKTGEIFPVLYSATVFELGGEHYRIVICADITEQQQTQQALREGEQKYRLLVENQQDLVVKVDDQGNFLYVSPSYCRTFGKTSEELLSKTYLPLVHEDDRAATERAVASLFQPPHTCYIEQRALTANGWRWLAWQDTAVLDKNGKVEAIIGVGRDITERKQAESERDRIFNFSMDMLSMVDASGCFRQLNPAWQKTLGWSLAEMLGHHYLEFVHPEDQFVTHQLAEAQTRGKEVSKFENRYRCKDGSYKWLSWNSVAMGEDQEIFAVARDVTEQNNTSEALRHSEERYRSLFVTMQTGFALHEIICDETGEPTNYRFLEINPAFEQITGLNACELIGKTVLEMMPGTEPYWIKLYGKVALTGEPALIQNYSSELHRYYEGIVYCHQPGQFAVLFSDITERKEMEIALRQSEDRYRSLVEHSPDAIAVHCDGFLQYANLAAVQLARAQKPEDLVGKPMLQFVHPDQHPAVIARIQHMMATGEAASLSEEKFIALDGTVTDVEVSALPIQYNGKPAVQVIFRDISVRIQVEQKIHQLNAELEQRVAERTAQLEAANRDLEAVNKELEAFTYSVSHDLRAPLRGIDGYSKILLDIYCDTFDEQGLHYLQRLREASQWMTQLVNDLLDLSRMSRTHIIFEQVNLSELAQAIVAELRESQPERFVEVLIQPDLLAHADANLIRVVLDNLLRNAWKFTSKRPQAKIEVGCRIENGESIFYVRDDGAGFDMAYSEKLFMAFQRLHTNAEFEGTGIGLAIVQRIIYRHGGRVWAEGELGQGATFYFTFS